MLLKEILWILRQIDVGICLNIGKNLEKQYFKQKWQMSEHNLVIIVKKLEMDTYM